MTDFKYTHMGDTRVVSEPANKQTSLMAVVVKARDNDGLGKNEINYVGNIIQIPAQFQAPYVAIFSVQRNKRAFSCILSC